jgi:hypothetical protein
VTDCAGTGRRWVTRAGAHIPVCPDCHLGPAALGVAGPRRVIARGERTGRWVGAVPAHPAVDDLDDLDVYLRERLADPDFAARYDEAARGAAEARARLVLTAGARLAAAYDAVFDLKDRAPAGGAVDYAAYEALGALERLAELEGVRLPRRFDRKPAAPPPG